MNSVRFTHTTHPLLALIIVLGLTAGYAMSAEPVSKAPGNSKPASPAPTAQVQLVTRHIKINIPSRTLWVYEGERIVRFFPVGVGRVGFPTPTGKFSVIRKVEDPGWENPYMGSGKMRLAPGEDNPLGTRWIGFLQNSGGEYGMHGTDNPTSVGKLSSHGCVRLKIPDAEVLFNLVEVGTPVEVVYQPVIIRRHADEVRVAVYADKFRRGMPSVAAIKADIVKQFPSAKVDEEELKAALSQPLEKYVRVGLIDTEIKPPDALQTTPEKGPVEKVILQPIGPLEN
ncbi:L,D-transpeptidase [Vampirovibrio sp.]|uniref:L,D-transpeptidase n=1 Tax=Vampirovibrio sp. TaxID=2717857 RepID=UPI0035939135